MGGHHRPQRLHHPGVEHGVALAALRQRVVGLVAQPLCPQVGVAAADRRHVQAFENAETLLAPQRLDQWRHQRRDTRHAALGIGHRLRGLARTLQVTDHQQVDGLAGQALAEPARLLQPQRIQGHIDLALEAVLAVPIGFTMADHDQLGHAAIVGAARRRRCGGAVAKP
jgi:hypothetical protein